tara:strand:+ start:1194 stop:1658 length:465 start_codon:yes stop_codon:yes gene_type:complete
VHHIRDTRRKVTGHLTIVDRSVAIVPLSNHSATLRQVKAVREVEELPLALASESVVALGEKGETSVVALAETEVALEGAPQVANLEEDPKIFVAAFHLVGAQKEWLPEPSVMASAKIGQELLRFRLKKLHHWPNHRLHVQYPMHPLFEFQDGLD